MTCEPCIRGDRCPTGQRLYDDLWRLTDEANAMPLPIESEDYVEEDRAIRRMQEAAGDWRAHLLTGGSDA